jgi:hypothetical protein
VHGNLFAFLNIMICELILKLPVGAFSAIWVAWLDLAGMLMPMGRVATFAPDARPCFVLGGGIALL